MSICIFAAAEAKTLHRHSAPAERVWNEIQPVLPQLNLLSDTQQQDAAPSPTPARRSFIHLRPAEHEGRLMFNPSPPSRKHAPSVTDGHALAPEPLMSDTTWPPPGAKMRISKGAVVVRGVRRQPSPKAGSLESLEAVWGQKEQAEVAPRSPGAREARNGIEGHGGAPPRARKNRFRAPDVRTIFSPGEKDPRVKEESGEGHTFQVGGENTWCDFCCQFIVQDVLTCSGKRSKTEAE